MIATSDQLRPLKAAAPTDVARLELLEERVDVSRRIVAGQTVRVATTTQFREQQVDETLMRETADVERVPVGRIVDAVPDTRHEGDVTIIPVVEEVLVLERRLFLKEEVRIRRIRTTEVRRETVQLRQQVATITRSGTSAATDAARPSHQPTSEERAHP